MTKNLLLLATAAMAAVTVQAQEEQVSAPEAMPSYVISQVSPNGKWGLSVEPFMGIFSVINLETGDSDDYEEAYDYTPGSGNCVSNNGIVLLSLTYDGTPSYWKDGQILTLPIQETDNSAFSCGVTPDGSRIVGTIGIPMSLDAPDIMQKPVIWDLQSDGTYGEYKRLPYPDKDWTGRMPQYILTNSISADGKTIIGQVHDYEGTTDQPIVWHEDADGNWSYEFIHPELVVPNDVEIPEPCADAPERPDAENYMTEEQKAAYDAAMAEYRKTYENYPEPTDYLSEEALAQYNSDMAAYQTAYAAWEESFYAFNDALYAAREGGMNFLMNSTLISPNGRYYTTSDAYINWWSPDDSYAYPVTFDMLTGEYFASKVEGALIAPTYVNDEGVVLGCSPASDYTRRAYISVAPGQEMKPLDEWVAEKNPALYQWMKENCTHDVLSYAYNEDIDEWEEVTLTDQWLTGTPVADADLKTIYSWNYNNWDETDPNYFYTYVLPLDYNSGVVNVIAEGKKLNLKAAKGGVVTLNGDAKSLVIYDMQGRKVYENNAPAAVTATGLEAGFYTVCATSADGKKTVVKATF